MVKILIHIFAVSLISILFTLLYYAFFSYSKYSGKPEFIPSPIIPLFVIVLLTIGILYAKYFMKLKLFPGIGISVFMAFVFISLTLFIHSHYGYIFQHYYQKFPYSNLLSIQEYSNEKGNYLTVRDRVKDKGISVDIISEGNTDLGDSNIRETPFTKMIYLINSQQYIIFDWNQKEITAFINKEELQQIAEEQLNTTNLTIIQYEGSFIGVKQADGKTSNYKLIPTDNDQINISPI